MKEVLFRGKRKAGNEWLYGDLNHIEGKVFIFPRTEDAPLNSPDWFEIDPDTLGQFTGQLAPKRKTHLEEKVFEGDVFRQEDGNWIDGNWIEYLVVMWIEERSAFYMVPTAHYYVILHNDVSKEADFEWLFNDAALYDFSIDCGLTKVGNIHDNPELLK